MSADTSSTRPTQHIYMGRAFTIQAEFPYTEEGTKQANAFMLAHPGIGVLEVISGRVILAANADKGVPVTQEPAARPTPLRFEFTDNGNCRVYYRGPRDANRIRNLRLYCYQAGVPRGTFELYACTSAGEPEYKLTIGNFAIDRWPDDNSVTAQEFSDFALNHIFPIIEEQDQ